MPLENQIRREDIGYRLSKALEIKGQGTPVLQLDSVVVPVVVVEDLNFGNELDYQSTRWCRGRGSSPAGAAFGKLSFNNHADSGVLVKVYQASVYAGGVSPTPPGPLSEGFIIGVTIETASAGGTQINFTKQFTDSRLSHGDKGLTVPIRLPSVDIRHDNSGGLAGHSFRGFVPTTGLHLNFGGLVLRPGTRLHFEAIDIALEFNASVEWTETNV